MRTHLKKIISLFIIGAFLSTACFAQEAAQGKILTLKDFSGGLNLKSSSLGLAEKYAVVANNVRLNTEGGSVQKRAIIYTYGQASASEPITGMHRLYLSNGTKQLIATHGSTLALGNDSLGTFSTLLALTSANNLWQFLTWHNFAIGGDGFSQPIKYDGTTATYLGTCAAVDSGVAGNPNGTYTYKVSFYTTVGSYEVIFDTPSNAVTVSSHKVNLTNIPIGPVSFLGNAVVGRKVYRVEAGVWKLLSNGTIADNVTTTLLDNDTTASGAVYPAGTQTWKPPKGKFYLISFDRLFIAGDPNAPSTIYYSEDGNPDLFQPINLFNIRLSDGDAITFIKNLLGVLTIGKTNTIQKLYTGGTSPLTDWSISEPFSFTGCVAPYSAVNTPEGIYYLGTDGIYKFNGQSSLLVSDIITPTIKDILPAAIANCWGAYDRNTYYLSYSSKLAGTGTNNRVLLYDLIGQSYVIDPLNINCFAVFNAGTDVDILFAGGSTIGNVYTYGSTSQQIIHAISSDFTGTYSFMVSNANVPSLGGSPSNPILALGWDCTLATWLTELQAMNASVTNIGNIITYLPNATLAIPQTTGTYISQVLNTAGAKSYNTFYWNELLSPFATTTATIAVRSGAVTPVDGSWSAWSSEYSNSAGSVISAVGANDYTQYRITLGTNNTAYTPEVYRAGNYVTEFTYNTLGTALDTNIAMQWTSGWLQPVPTYNTSLRKFEIWYESASAGTLTVTLTGLQPSPNNTTPIYITQVFSIPMSTYGNYFYGYFDSGTMLCSAFKIDIQNSDLYSLTVQRINLTYDVEEKI